MFVAVTAASLSKVRWHRLAGQGSRALCSSSSSLPSSSPSTSSKEVSARKKSNLYTRTGDKGTSSLYNGERRSKTDPIFEALGGTDELNASIGIAREHCELVNNGLQHKLAEIQSRLFDLGANIATPASSSDEKKAYTEFPVSHTLKLEQWIDEIDSQLPPLKNFVIPSGGLCSTHLNMARAICRRAERQVVVLLEMERVSAETAKYLNRLSDFLFAASRFAAMHSGHVEILWKKHSEN